MLDTVKFYADLNKPLSDKPFDRVLAPVYKCKGFYSIPFEVSRRGGLVDTLETYVSDGSKTIEKAMADIEAIKKIWFKPL
jgi:hypothetical protein